MSTKNKPDHICPFPYCRKPVEYAVGIPGEITFRRACKKHAIISMLSDCSMQIAKLNSTQIGELKRGLTLWLNKQDFK